MTSPGPADDFIYLIAGAFAVFALFLFGWGAMVG